MLWAAAGESIVKAMATERRFNPPRRVEQVAGWADASRYGGRVIELLSEDLERLEARDKTGKPLTVAEYERLHKGPRSSRRFCIVSAWEAKHPEPEGEAPQAEPASDDPQTSPFQAILNSDGSVEEKERRMMKYVRTRERCSHARSHANEADHTTAASSPFIGSRRAGDGMCLLDRGNLRVLAGTLAPPPCQP